MKIGKDRQAGIRVTYPNYKSNTLIPSLPTIKIHMPFQSKIVNLNTTYIYIYALAMLMRLSRLTVKIQKNKGNFAFKTSTGDSLTIDHTQQARINL
jgi:hypothetical protein